MRRVVGPLGLVLLPALLTACTGDDGDSAERAAETLAAGLSSGDLDEVDFVEATSAEVGDDYEATRAGMDGVEPQVEAGDVEEDGDSATATLTWSWTLGRGEHAWTYDSEVRLTRSEGDWRVAWGRDVVEPGLGPNASLDRTTIHADRGDILGAGGRKLVTERPVVRVGIDRSHVDDRQAVASARELARLTDIDVKPYVRQVRAAGPRAFVPALVYRDGEVPPPVVDGRPSIRGAVFYSDDQALAPTREFAAPILGTVGEVTAEMIEDDPERYRVGDAAGRSGLQQRYDEQLRGVDGVAVQAVAGNGRKRELFRAEPEPGEPVRVTMSLGLQRTAERLLSDVGPPSAIVAVRPSDGAVLAAANGPGTDGYNVATFGQFAPGSTFKTVSALALLRSGLSPDEPVHCPADVVVDGKRFTNYSDYPASALGQIPFRTAVAESCNTAFIGQRERLGNRGLVDAAATLGLGVDHDVGFPAYFGSVEAPESKTGRAADMIGQGTVLASPLSMAAVIASVQRGELVVPRLVESVEVEPHEHDPLTDAEAQSLRSMLRGVVTDGSGSGLADVPGPPVLAKTGTAEFSDDGELATHAWMIAAQGDLAVAVFVQRGRSGSQTAGPILEGLLRAAR